MVENQFSVNLGIDRKPVEILSNDNPCGRILLNIVSRGHCVISELTKLSQHIPSIFRLNNAQDVEKYGSLLVDFSYFKNVDAFESKLIADIKLQEIDDELRQTFSPILNRIFLTFEGACRFIHDLKQLLKDIDRGVYPQLTFEVLISNKDGKQLICEAVFLIGFMLLYVDMKFDGNLRERLLVSYHRYCPIGSSMDSHRDFVFQLFTNTDCIYGPKGNLIKRPNMYPEEYFQRAVLPCELIDAVVGCLRADDIYNMVSVYPHPDDRTTALSFQSGMLYVVLFFAPDVLNNKNALMTEIVNKFFLDSWIINIYMGTVVNLIHMWNPYKAARVALSRVLTPDDIRSIVESKLKILQTIPNPNLDSVWEKFSSDQYVLVNHQNILKIIRSYNIVIKWLLLHSYDSGCILKLSTTLRDVCVKHPLFDMNSLLIGMFSTAKLENFVKETLTRLLETRETRWNENKNTAMQHLQDLSDLFSGASTLRIEKNVNLCEWFKSIKKRVEDLDILENVKSGSRLNGIYNSLKDVKEFHQLENISHVCQTLETTRFHLAEMLQFLHLRNDCLIDLQFFSDFSYAWILILELVSYIHIKIRSNPEFVIHIRFIIIKLSSGMDVPLERLNQAKNPDFYTISHFYSTVLVDYVRKFLQTLPSAVFDIIMTLMKLLNEVLLEIPHRLDKNKIKEYHQSEERFQISQLVYKIAQYSDGILKMKSTLVGIVQLDPKLLLEEGINQELIFRVSTTLHNTLNFNSKTKINRNVQLLTVLKTLSQQMDAFFRTFEYVQDYMKINGLKMWIQSLSIIVEFYLNKECDFYLQPKGISSFDHYNADKYLIPVFPSVDSESATFLGRLIKEIIDITNPTSTLYVYSDFKWFQMTTKKEILNGIHLIQLIKQCLGVHGLISINKLLSVITSEHIKNVNVMMTVLSTNKEMSLVLDKLSESIKSPINTFNANLINNIKMMDRQIQKILQRFSQIGQLQIIKKLISMELITSGSFHSHILVSAVENLNKSIILDFNNLDLSTYSSLKEYCDEKESIRDFSDNVDAFGISESNLKKYCVLPRIQKLNSIIYILFYYLSDKYMYIKKDLAFIPLNNPINLDLYPVILGIATFSRQHSADANKKISSLLLRHVYLKSLEISFSTSPIQKSFEEFIFNSFVTYLVHAANLNPTEISDIIPPLHKNTIMD